MKNTRKILFFLIVVCTLALATGCATKQMPKSGFLMDYSRLKADDPMKKADWVYINENVNFGSYKKIMMDQVVFIIKDDAKYKGIQADEVKELSEAFAKAVVEALGGSYEFTAEPGPDVMRLRLAITGVVPNKRAVGTITTVVPIGLGLSIVKKGLTGSHIGVGGAAFEGELMDSQTGEVLGAAIDAETGTKYRIDKTVTKYGQVKLIFADWANTLKQRLDKLSGRE